MTSIPVDPTDTAAIDACAREPIHLLGAVQPHGFLLTLKGADMTVAHASANAAACLGVDDAGLKGRPLADGAPALHALMGECLGDVDAAAEYLRTVTLGAADHAHVYDVAAHRLGDLIILEFEQREEATPRDLAPNLDARLRTFVGDLHLTKSVEDTLSLTAREVRQITGFDRVLIYRFDPNWNGAVVAEDRNDALPSYLGLRFPASDIPAQARELYRRNRVRIIPDAGYAPQPILPAAGESAAPLDLSQSVLRSVSPVHLEYMRNMGTMASMSVSILIEGELWGLVSCHNRTPRRVSLQARNACDLLTEIFALQLAARERAALVEKRVELGSIQSRLLGYMAEEERFLDGLIKHPEDACALAEADGLAIVSNDQCRLIGVTPDKSAVWRIFSAISQRRGEEDVFFTDHLDGAFPGICPPDVASGVLAISISQKFASYILWFRPEVVKTVRWGGEPTKAVQADPVGGLRRIHPRQSFEAWKEIVHARSLPWSAPVVEAARELRSAVIGVVLRRAEEMASLSEDLQRSNKELEAFSYSVSHDLRAPFRHIVGYSELLRALESDNLSDKGKRYIETIIDSAYAAGTLVDNLLAFSQMGRSALTIIDVDMNALFQEVRRKVALDIEPGREVEWIINPMPAARADPVMLRLAVENLMSNAIKYSRGSKPAIIEVGGEGGGEGREAIYHVRDNGVGFDMAYVGKLFGVFQRLHRAEEFEGTGIGLANVKRIIERHGGRTWAEGELGKGATFFFTLPT